MTLALVSVALASLLAGEAVATSSRVAGGVALAGMAGIIGLVAALFTGVRAVVAPAVGLLALAALGANGSSYALVPFESATLVAVAFLAWWSIDERHPVVAEPRVDQGRTATAAALVLSAACSSALVVAMSSVASAGLVAAAAGSVGLASISAGLWSVARLRRYETEHRR